MTEKAGFVKPCGLNFPEGRKPSVNRRRKARCGRFTLHIGKCFDGALFAHDKHGSDGMFCRIGRRRFAGGNTRNAQAVFAGRHCHKSCGCKKKMGFGGCERLCGFRGRDRNGMQAVLREQIREFPYRLP